MNRRNECEAQWRARMTTFSRPVDGGKRKRTRGNRRAALTGMDSIQQAAQLSPKRR